MGCVRVGIFGVGLGAIAGTTLTTFPPTRFIQAEQDKIKDQGTTIVASAQTDPAPPNPIYPQQVAASVADWMAVNGAKFWPAPATAINQSPTPTNSQAGSPSAPKTTAIVSPTSESTALKAKLTKLAATQAPKIVPHAYFIDVDNGEFVSLNGNQSLPAASTIKIPVAIAFFQAVDQGKIQLHEQLPLTKDVVGSGAGTMQYELGKRQSYSALEVVTKMIVISDNTATNMIIKRLGGKETLNQQFQTWPMPATKLNNYLPDLEGTNTTSPQDLAMVLVKLQHGDLLSLKSRDRLLDIMQQTQTRTLLPQGLEPGAVISHKTGDIGTIIGDAGVIDMPSGKRYVGAVIATRPFNDIAGRTLIQDISRTVYQHYKGMTPPAPMVAEQAKPVTPGAKPPEPKPKAAPTPQ
jgi:beta-lactamase class A